MRTKNVIWITIFVTSALACTAESDEKGSPSREIIDVHVHAYPALTPSAEDSTWIPLDLPLPESDSALMAGTVERMDHHNISLGVLSGSRASVAAWVDHAPGRFIRGVQISNVSGSPESVETVRGWIESGEVEAFGEFSVQYAGMPMDDDRVQPYMALLEELDIPLLVHLGPGPRHKGAQEGSRYSIAAGNPLGLERVLSSFPNLRVCILHAGWPFGDEVIAMLHTYPQVYVGTGVINWYIDRAEFHSYLKRIIDAGFSDRVLFGSDQMHWPGAIDLAIEAIDEAPFLSGAQKQAIFYDNAAQFLKISS